jgi:integrase
MTMTTASVIVKYRTVSISVFPWRHSSGREYWKFHHGARTVTRATLEAAKLEAKRIAEDTYLRGAGLPPLGADQIRAIRRMLEADPRLSMVDEFLVWHTRRAPKKDCQEAIAEFLAVKTANAGLSRHNVANLTRHLAHLPTGPMSEITPANLPAIPGAARTRRNVIGAWITFFRWAQRMEYLPHGEPTAPERLEKPIVPRKVPATYTPEELQTLLQHVTPAYLPWLALGAYAGLRTEEVCPDHASGKDAIRWEDFAWDRQILVVRPEVAKTGHRRIVPILPALEAILRPLAATGRVGPFLPPHTPPKGGKLAETTRLGKFIKGWKRNALRHSFISYRAAQVGLVQTAMEAGNSESEARRSYNDAKSPEEAGQWFAIIDPKTSNGTRNAPEQTESHASPVSGNERKPLKNRAS